VSALKQSVNSFTRSKAGAYINTTMVVFPDVLIVVGKKYSISRCFSREQSS